jgi:hypothetical protein
LAIRPYSANACPKGVGRPSRPNIRSRSYARTCPVTSEPATRSMSGQCMVTLFRFTLLRARSSSGPQPPVSTPGISARQNRWSFRSLKRGEKL